MRSGKSLASIMMVWMIGLAWALPAMATERYTWYFFRHAEKAEQPHDPPLSAAGQQRAQALRETLRYANLEAVYSTPFQRTQQTALPVAEFFDIPVRTYAADDAASLVRLLQAERKNSLIIGHSNTIPTLVRLAGGSAHDLSEQEYGWLFILRWEDGKLSVSETRQVNSHASSD